MYPRRIQDGRPSLRPGTPGGSEEGDMRTEQYVEENDASTKKIYT
jgi:hypothetical protein